MNLHKKGLNKTELAYFFSWLWTEFENSYTKLSSKKKMCAVISCEKMCPSELEWPGSPDQTGKQKGS